MLAQQGWLENGWGKGGELMCRVNELVDAGKSGLAGMAVDVVVDE